MTPPALDLRRRPATPPPRPPLDVFRSGARTLPPDLDALDVFAALHSERSPEAPIAPPAAVEPADIEARRRTGFSRGASVALRGTRSKSTAGRLPSVLAAFSLALAPTAGVAGSGSARPTTPRRSRDGNPTAVGGTLDLRPHPSPHLDRAAAPDDRRGQEPRSGVPLLAVGIPLTVAGGVLLGVGIGLAQPRQYYMGYGYVGRSYPAYAGYWAPPIIAGGSMLAVGVPFTVRGVVQEQERRQWKRGRVGLAGLHFDLGPRRWTGELRFRF